MALIPKPILLCLCLLLSLPLEAAGAKRIIALSPHTVEMLFAIGAGEAIVATTDHADYPEAARAIPSIGGNYGIQIERVLELKPDLILVWRGGNRAEDIDRLKTLGIPLFASAPMTLAAVADELELLGELTGHVAQAKRVAAQYRSELSALGAEYLDKPRLRVFYQMWASPLMTVSRNSWIQQSIDLCRGDNVFVDAAGDYPQVSMENVLLTRPEVILQSRDPGNADGLDWTKWPEIPAVQRRHIYQLDADLLYRTSPRALQGTRALCEALDRARGSEEGTRSQESAWHLEPGTSLLTT